MMKSSRGLVVTLAVCALAGIGVFACNTLKGAGRDIAEEGNIGAATENPERTTRHSGPHMITASAESGGSITPQGSTSVPRGSSQTFIATANTGYRVADVLVDGLSVGPLADLFHDNSSSYTFNNVAANHEISATFNVNKRR